MDGYDMLVVKIFRKNVYDSRVWYADTVSNKLI